MGSGRGGWCNQQNGFCLNISDKSAVSRTGIANVLHTVGLICSKSLQWGIEENYVATLLGELNTEL